MKYLALAAFVAWLAWEYRRATRQAQIVEAEEAQQRALQVRENQQRFLRDLCVAPPVLPRVVESDQGVFVRASCPEEAAEIVSQSTAFNPRAA